MAWGVADHARISSDILRPKSLAIRPILDVGSEDAGAAMSSKRNIIDDVKVPLLVPASIDGDTGSNRAMGIYDNQFSDVIVCTADSKLGPD